MYKIGVMGGRETVMGFKALGLDVFPVDSADEARHTLRRITSGESEYAILYLEENLAAELSHEIDRFKDSPTPAIILIPGRDGTDRWWWPTVWRTPTYRTLSVSANST